MSERSVMRRISPELDKLLERIAADLSVEVRKPVTVVNASKILAATNPNPIILMKKRREVRAGGSLIYL